MNKSIFKTAVAVAVTAAAVFCVGCSEKPDDGGGNGLDPNNLRGGDLTGDWLWVDAREEYNGESRTRTISTNDYKQFWSFKPSGDLVFTQFDKIGDFWIGYPEPASYRVNGNSVCIIEGDDGDADNEYCMSYGVSDNTLMAILRECYNGDCGSVTFTFARGNLATIENSLGKVYSRNPALIYTDWRRSSESGENYNIYFGDNDCDASYYISDSYRLTWYTDDTHMTLVELECAKYETIYEDEYEYTECVSYSVKNTVKFDYELSGGTLRLRTAGSDVWDVWTRYDNMKKAKANSKKETRSISPFQSFRR